MKASVRSSRTTSILDHEMVGTIPRASTRASAPGIVPTKCALKAAAEVCGLGFVVYPTRCAIEGSGV